MSHCRNYGAIGFFIGHELTHAFDDAGSRYGADGNLINWWKNNTEKQFVDRAKCLIEQYENFTEPTTNLKVRLFFEGNLGINNRVFGFR